MAWYHRVWNVVRPGRHWRELDEELSFHVAERTEALIASGMEPEAAAREARRRFGNPVAQRERTRDEDIVVWLESLLADVRYAARGLVRSPGFTAVAVLSLALGIGANTGIFSLTNALLLKSLPVRHPEELVQLTMADGGDWFTNPIWEQVRDGQDEFSGLFAYGDARFNLAPGGVARYASGARVSGDFFPTLGVRPAAGRLLRPEDDVRGCPAVAAVSGGFARREYGGAEAAVGRTLMLDGQPYEVVGVADPAFTGIEVGRIVDVYTPLCTYAIHRGPTILDARSMWYLAVMGRPAEGVTPAAARAAVKARAPAVYAATLPEDWRESDQQTYLQRTLDVRPATTGLSALREQYGTALLALLGVVGLVLLIACANIANLMLARAATRRRESAIRRAIGAGRARLIRQLLTESLLLSAVGAAAGVLFAGWAGRLLVSFLSTGANRVWLDLSLDARVLVFTIVVATATGILFGLAPAWRGARVDPQSAMRAGGRGVVGRGGHGSGKALVVGQVALSLVLIVAAGLLLGSFRTLSTLDPGFDRAGILLVRADFEGADLDEEARLVAWRELLGGLRALPGVNSASASALTPIGRGMWNQRLLIPGYTSLDGREPVAFFNEVSEGYFATMGTPLLAGRDIEPGDDGFARRVAVINQAAADAFFGGGNPLGRTFRTQLGPTPSEPIEVVGVVRSAKYRSLAEDPPPTIYVPIAGGGGLYYELRVDGRPGALAPAVQSAAGAISPGIALEITTMADQLADSLTRPRLLATLSGFFGAVALLLAVIGLYGTLSYGVTRRRSEIGIRMALGAARRRVVAALMAEAGRLVVIGLVIGTILALAGMRLIEAFLYGLEPTDPAVFAGAAAVLAAVAMAAALLPAWRAARVEPMETLREDG